MTIRRQHPQVSLKAISQYQWGATAVKPTGLLGFNTPQLVPHLRVHVIPDAPLPEMYDMRLGSVMMALFVQLNTKNILLRSVEDWQGFLAADFGRLSLTI